MSTNRGWFHDKTYRPAGGGAGLIWEIFLAYPFKDGKYQNLSGQHGTESDDPFHMRAFANNELRPVRFRPVYSRFDGEYELRPARFHPILTENWVPTPGKKRVETKLFQWKVLASTLPRTNERSRAVLTYSRPQ